MYYEGVGGVMFAENIELLIFSTPVKCLVVREQVVDVSEGDSTASDNPTGSGVLPHIWCC